MLDLRTTICKRLIFRPRKKEEFEKSLHGSLKKFVNLIFSIRTDISSEKEEKEERCRPDVFLVKKQSTVKHTEIILIPRMLRKLPANKLMRSNTREVNVA